MRYIVVCVLLPLSLTTVRSQTFDEQVIMSYYDGASITYDKEKPNLQKKYAIVEGEKRVFSYLTDNGGDPGNHNVAWSTFAFWVDQNEESFELRDAEIMEHDGVYVQLCRCQDRGIKSVEKGVVRGTRIDLSTWHIEIDVKFKGRTTEANYHLKTEGDFKLIALD